MKRGRRRDLLPPSRGEVVHDVDVVPLGKQDVGKIGSDESGTTGHERNGHHGSLVAELEGSGGGAPATSDRDPNGCAAAAAPAPTRPADGGVLTGARRRRQRRLGGRSRASRQRIRPMSGLSAGGSDQANRSLPR